MDIDDCFDNVLGQLSQSILNSESKSSSQSSSSTKPNATSSSTGTKEESKLPVKLNTSSSCVIVNSKQRGNPILKYILNVPLQFQENITPDYIVGATTCILYISLKYHNMNPNYICQRLKELGKQYELRVLLVQIDMPEPHKPLKNLTRISLLTDLTLILAWNAEEAGKIIETYKLYEKKSSDLIMEKTETGSYQKLITALTNIKPINKTDALILLQNFEKMENLINCSEDRLTLCTGLGPRKVKKLYKTLNEPFLRKIKK